MTLDPKRWRSDRKFEHLMIPRWKSQPNGPKIASMCHCTCGRRWNEHEFSTGACPNETEFGVGQ